MQRLLKRQIDFWGAFLGLIILAIPFTVVALAIKLDSKGPVFFRQERVGKDGRSFKVWKFRTMVVGAVRKGLGYNVAKDDSRITRIGSVLRNWDLDELPPVAWS
jgi:lipopolysaccharide/colanic/teichoic acid biosynthesis glycosyltransferase